MNCCSSRRGQKDKNVIDFDKELTGEMEVAEDAPGDDKDLDELFGEDKIGNLFKPSELLDKYLQDNLEDAADHFDQVG